MSELRWHAVGQQHIKHILKIFTALRIHAEISRAVFASIEFTSIFFPFSSAHISFSSIFALPIYYSGTKHMQSFIGSRMDMKKRKLAFRFNCGRRQFYTYETYVLYIHQSNGQFHPTNFNTENHLFDTKYKIHHGPYREYFIAYFDFSFTVNRESIREYFLSRAHQLRIV